MAEARQFDRKRITRQVILSVFISLGTIVFIFSLVSFRGITIDLSSFRSSFFLVGAVLVVIGWMVDATRVWVNVRALGRKIRFRDALTTVLSGYFMSSITPFATGGSPAQMYVLGRAGLTWGEAGSLVVVCGILYQVSLLCLLLLLIFGFHIGFSLEGFLLRLLYSFALFYSVLISLLLLFLRKPHILYRLVDGGIAIVKKYFKRIHFSEESVREWTRHFLEEFSLGFSILFSRKPQYLVWNIICYMVQYSMVFSVAYFVLRSLGTNPPYLGVLGAQIPLYFIFSLVPSPGASGGAEIVMLSAFIRYAGAQRVGMFVLLWRIIIFYLPLLVGGYAFFRMLKLGNNQPINNK